MPKFNYFRVEEKEMRVLSRAEQAKLVNLMREDCDVYKLGVLIALYTGVRVGELCALRWGDVNDGYMTVRGTMQRLGQDGGGTKIIVTAPKTKHSARTIPLLFSLNELLEGFRTWQEGESFVISTPKKRITEPRVMQYKFKRYMEALGIEGASFHTLRHTFATMSVEAGMDVKSLSELFGHANVQITLNRYVHSSLAQKRKSIEMLSSFYS